MRRMCILAIVFASIPAYGFTTIWYVNQANTAPAPDGSSWANAFTTIEPAIAAASSGDEIWIAAGEYDETRSDPGGALVLKPGLRLYGGFLGTETILAQRDWTIHETIIQGAVARGGAPAYHVISTADRCVISGFTITGGNAAGSSFSEYIGGGILAYDTSLGATPWTGATIEHCVFGYNGAAYGGAIAMVYGVATIEDCVFHQNGLTYASGGAIWATGGSVDISGCRFDENGNEYTDGGAVWISAMPYSIKRCRFNANVASYGGGVYVTDTPSSGTIENCLFNGNRAGLSWPVGGGVCIDNGAGASVVNCTFYNNWAADGSAICSINNAVTAVTNCIVRSNVGGFQVTGVNLTVTYSDVEDMTPAGTNIAGDPQFYNVASNDFRLRTSSPCRNTGTNAGAPAEDLDGKPRPREGTCDMGALEAPATYFVSKASPKPAATGTSWADPFSTLQPAIDAAWTAGSGEVWVSAGIYDEDRSSFVLGNVELRSGVVMYGGFAGTETSSLERDWTVNETIIDGSIARAGAPALSVVHPLSDSVLDGFTVMGGNATAPQWSGGGIYVGGSNFRAVNCRIQQNQAAALGGGVFQSLHDASYDNCQFVNNYAAMEGGACYVDSANTAQFTDCVFEGNSSGAGGGAVSNYDVTLVDVYNCRFRNNTSTVAGGALRPVGGATRVVNTEFFGNSSPEGGAIRAYNGAIYMEHATFYGNSSAAGPAMWLANESPVTIANSILWGSESSVISVVAGPSPIVFNSDIKGSTDTSNGNLNENPLFIDGGAGILFLQTGSPCIDTGATLPHIVDDLRHVARPQSLGYDMGAFEMRPYKLQISVKGNGATTPVAGLHQYFEQTSFDIFTTPSPGWYCAAWQGDVSSTADTAWILMDRDKSVTAVFKKCKLTVKWPNGGETLTIDTPYTVTWESRGPVGDSVRIELIRKEAVVHVLKAATPNDGSQKCRIPEGTKPTAGYRIRVTSVSASEYSDESNKPFTLVSDES